MKTIIVFLANIVLLTGCAANRSETMKTQGDATAMIRQYVSTQKGWNPSQCRIELGEHRRAVTMYVVVYLEDEKRAIPGGGESFEVEYDPVQKRVLREIGLQ